MSDTSVTGARPLSLLLKMAVMAGVESAVRIHVQRGDDLNARDSNGLTPLMLSANRNRPAICKLLLDAGADDSLFDPSGKTALAIALAAGAHEAAVVLESAIVPTRGSEHLVPNVPLHSDGPIVSWSVQTTEKATDPIAANAIEADREAPTAQVETVEVQQLQDTLDFDLFGWEPEEDRLPPDVDSSVVEAATAIQSAITGYEPFDSSADWEDIDAYLPERSLPLARTDDAEGRERLRLLLLRAVREGSVPLMEVEALSLNEDRSANLEAKMVLRMVVNDLGAEVDERFEYASKHENFEVFVKPEATPDEEEIVENSLTFIVSLASHGTEPLRIYQKEFQRQRLISAQDEVLLGQTMESGLEKALDALAAWPRGVSLTLAGGNLVKSGQRPLSWISLGPVGSQPDHELVVDGESSADVAIHLSDEQVEPNDDSQFDILQPSGDQDSDFSKALGILASLPVNSIQRGTDWHAIRSTLSSLRLNWRFLLELADVANDDDPASAAQYVEAMMLHQRAREQMTVANLKLVFHLAKKYLYSGEPLDDLAQEGNIGLLKAVERFDWRRGFKFSTYATWWIRQQIGRHIADKCKTVRIPVHVHDKVQRLFREIQALELETGRAPKLDEISVRVGIPVHKVAALQRLALEPLVIHELDIDEMIAIEAQSDFVSPDPMDIVFQSELLETIDKLLSTLKPKEEQILRLRFGIGVENALTLEEVGSQYKVTRERVRQIEAKAIRKLKHPSRIDAFAYAVFGGPLPTNREEEESRSDPERAEQSLAGELMSPDIPTKGTPASLGVARPAKSSSIDRLLAQAVELGIDIDDDREGISGRLWVNLTEAADIRSRKLVRKLIDLGFEYCQGKGYWK